MVSIAKHRCFHHTGREAVARCPECERFYCRECVTEHDGRVICAGCLAAQQTGGKRRRAPVFLAAAFQWGIGLCVLWLFFYWLARILIAIPPAFHEGLGLD